MILHDVANDAVPVKVATAPHRANVLLERDLHRLDVVAVPQRLEKDVPEAQHEQILHQLLAQVVVDAVQLVLGERRGEQLPELPGAFAVPAKGLFDDHAIEPARGHARRLNGRAGGRKHVGRHGKIEHAVGRRAGEARRVLCAGRGQVHLGPGLGVVVPAPAGVGAERQEPLEGAPSSSSSSFAAGPLRHSPSSFAAAPLRHTRSVNAREHGAVLFAERGVGVGGARKADDAGVAGQVARQVQLEQRGVGLLLGQVARRAQHHHGQRLVRVRHERRGRGLPEGGGGRRRGSGGAGARAGGRQGGAGRGHWLLWVLYPVATVVL